MKLLMTFLACSTAFCGCDRASITASSNGSTAKSYDEQTVELRRELSTVKISDGISKSEAEFIAKCYFHKNVGCGGFTGIRDGGEYWSVEGKFGYAANSITGFKIDKRDGKVTSPIGPSYATPFEIFQ